MIKNILGMGPKVDIEALIKSGALILDVRSKGEYSGGHVKGSKNIPLDQLNKHLLKLKKDKPIITCCASGMRSASAANTLRSNGFTEVHNGGSWRNIEQYV